ncbi:adenosylcobinamide-GDP ribazoletransferase [Pontibacter sp. G13]|uniref:adenosylcobinamide-GDP ribazoletransferase n=1 Tax=Pontibacter sp. G13 TaxID=3074898 RepID=UPI00288A0EF0|nr:adenosylcobinamide-GDP ribazoletransferase [Pontibacter sp. G13]WNJ18215.1 adenosylcobinamide-GDP ribazoletransferase [Pontibacter sp. G13]
MKEEIRVFFTALMFYTRIPCPSWVDHSAEYLNKATRYFPMMGWIVGGFSALILAGAMLILPIPVAVILSIVASIYLTGAFHEDGFADVCDGYGGGWTSEKILEIMKDSRVGAYGVVGFVLLMSLKITSLMALGQAGMLTVVLAVWIAHSLSRWMATWMIFRMPYARANEDSKAKPVAKGMETSSLLFASIFGWGPILIGGWLISPYWYLVPIPMLLMQGFLGKKYMKWTNGYTGDGLGAVQQATEVVAYMAMLVPLHLATMA